MAEPVVALDVGEARIGLAAGRTGSSFAFGRGHLTRTGGPADVSAVEAFVRSERASLVVVGLPRRTDGSDSEQTSRVRQFAKSLREAGLEVVFEDERFTTRLATSQIRGSGVNRSGRREKGRVDEASAILILETYLARTAGAPTESPDE